MSKGIGKQRLIVYALRHDPKAIGVSLDEEGYCRTSDLLSSMRISMEELERAVDMSGGRLSFSAGKDRIRAAHGHSIKVEMPMDDVPPDVLYHGTSSDSVESIMAHGVKPMGRRYVHLSETASAAARVAKRHSSKIDVLTIDAKAMKRDGVGFHKSEDGVWLVERVEPKYVDEACV